MAKVTVTVLGSETPVVLDDIETVGEVKDEMECGNHTATVGGEPADDDEELRDGDFVDLAPSVKGG